MGRWRGLSGVAFLALALVVAAPGTADGRFLAEGSGHEPPVPSQIAVAQWRTDHPESTEAAAALAAAAGRTAPGPEGGPTITVTPATDLVHGDLVRVRGQGWGAGEELFAVYCGPGGLDDCEVLDGADGYGGFRASPSGGFSDPEHLDVVIDGSGGATDCRLVTCRVWVLGERPGSIGSAPVTFRPDGPDPTRHVVEVVPDTGLVDGDALTVTGDGFPQIEPGFGIARTLPCRTPVLSVGDCDLGEAQYLSVANSGHVQGTVVATAVLALGGGAHDCRLGGCALAVLPEDFASFDGVGELSEAAIAPLTFDPGGALRPPPTLTADPDTDLLDGNAVHLDGAGFDPNRGFQIAQCRAGATTFAGCLSNPIYFGWADDLGGIRGYFGLRATFRDGHGQRVDCRSTACSIIIGHGDLGRHAEALVSFDPGGALLDPAITVQPSTGLEDGEEVTINGTGWPQEGPLFGLDILQCPAAVQDSVDCWPSETVDRGSNTIPLAHTEAEAENTGMSFETTFVVREVLHLEFGGRVDCRVEDCVILAEDVFGDRSARAPISFLAADGPVTATPPFTG